MIPPLNHVLISDEMGIIPATRGGDGFLLCNSSAEVGVSQGT